MRANPSRVLVVDDEPLVRRLLRSFLEGHGVEVLEATNGAEALDVLTRDPGVTVVLLDLRMPLMTGQELIEELARRGNVVPVVVMTAFPLEDFEPARVKGLIQKPFQPSEVWQAIRPWLQGE